MTYENEQAECISTEQYFYLTENFEVIDKQSAEKLVRYIVYDKRAKLTDTVRKVMQNELTARERNMALDYWQNKMPIGDICEKYAVSRSSFYRTIDTVKKKLEASLKYVLYYNEILKPPTKEDFLSRIRKETSMEAQIEN